MLLLALIAVLAPVAFSASGTADNRSPDAGSSFAFFGVDQALENQNGQIGGYFYDCNTGHTYLYVESSQSNPDGWTWEDAIEEATSPEYAYHGTIGHLATISSWQERHVVRDVSTSKFPDTCVWNGVHDVDPKAHEREILFAVGPEAGSPLEYLTHLYDSSLDKSHLCQAYNKDTDAFFFADCSETKAILIEFECPGGMLPNWGIDKNAEPGVCLESGWYNDDRTHYYEVRLGYLDWGDNLELSEKLTFKCRSGHLATITTLHEDQLIFDYLDWFYAKDAWYLSWIGANDIETAHTEFDAGTPRWVWGDGPEKGQEIVFTDWADGGPENNPNKACVQLEPNGWHTKSCATNDYKIRTAVLEYECPSGYYFGEQCCEVINQCQVNNGGCGEHSECLKNSKGPYFCRCHSGYISNNDPRDGKNCVQINPCHRANPLAHNPCGQNSDCDFFGGKIHCTCYDGYFSHTQDGKYCLPIHSCHQDNGGCGEHSKCTNPTPDTVVCTCHEGYHSINTPQNGRDCVEIDTCSLHPHICGANSVCRSKQAAGSYECHCLPGYVTDNADQKDCVRITTPDIDPAPGPSTAAASGTMPHGTVPYTSTALTSTTSTTSTTTSTPTTTTTSSTTTTSWSYPVDEDDDDLDLDLSDDDTPKI